MKLSKIGVVVFICFSGLIGCHSSKKETSLPLPSPAQSGSELRYAHGQLPVKSFDDCLLHTGNMNYSDDEGWKYFADAECFVRPGVAGENSGYVVLKCKDNLECQCSLTQVLPDQEKPKEIYTFTVDRPVTQIEDLETILKEKCNAKLKNGSAG
jgi:hypothetical protein